jgi:hypothetical protein
MTTEDKMKNGIINELDRSLNDYELLHIWNPLYENYGYLIPEFKEKWESNYLKGFEKFNKPSKSESKINDLGIGINRLNLHNFKRVCTEGMG